MYLCLVSIDDDDEVEGLLSETEGELSSSSTAAEGGAELRLSGIELNGCA